MADQRTEQQADQAPRQQLDIPPWWEAVGAVEREYAAALTPAGDGA